MKLPDYNLIDIFVLIVLCFGLLQGLRRKLSGELARLLSVIVAIAVGWRFYMPVGRYLIEKTRLSEQGAYLAAFCLCLLGVFALVLVFRFILRHLIDVSMKGGFINRFGGALLGTLRVLIVCSTILYCLSLVPYQDFQEAIQEKSFFGRIATHQLPRGYNKLRKLIPRLPKLPGDHQNQQDQPAVAEEESLTPSFPHDITLKPKPVE